MSTDIKGQYYQWLIEKIDSERLDIYRMVLKMLHKKEFYYINAMDENRNKDGQILRDRFVYEYFSGDPTKAYDALEGPASMLEVMIGLAERMDAELYLPAIQNREEYVDSFWELFCNAGFDQLKDCDIFDSWDDTSFDKKVTKILERKYNKAGEGGFFPIKGRLRDDQRKLELWYQMQSYLIENYPVGEENLGAKNEKIG